MRGKVLLWVCAALLTAAFAGCAVLPPKETVLRVALPSFGAEVLDPSMDGFAGLPYHGHLFDPLVGAAPDGRLSPQRGALERWEASPDATAYTLTLRRGMRWHDGVEVTSADVAFSLGHYAREAAACAGCPALRGALERVQVLDRYTVRVHLKRPNVVFPHSLGSVQGDMPLLPKHYWERLGAEGFAERPLGSGPWRFARRAPGQSIEYEANRDYWDRRRLPGFDRLRLLLVPRAEDRVAMLRAGEVDMTILSLADVEPLRREGFAFQGPQYVAATTLRFFASYDPAYLTSRLEFRKALALALDLPSLVRAVYPPEAASPGMGSALFSPASVGHDPAMSSYPYDPEAARALLRQAGYGGETVTLLSVVAYGLTEMVQMNELMAEAWRQAGVNVRVILTDFPSVLARYAARPQGFQDLAPAPLFHGAFANQPDTLSVVRRYMTSAPDGVLAYHDLEKGDRVYAELGGLAEPEARARRLLELNRELSQEYWALPIVWRHDVYGLRPGLEGWLPTDGVSTDLHLETLRPAKVQSGP